MKLSFGQIKMSNANIIEFKYDKRKKSVYENMRTYIQKMAKTFKNNLLFSNDLSKATFGARLTRIILF